MMIFYSYQTDALAEISNHLASLDFLSPPDYTFIRSCLLRLPESASQPVGISGLPLSGGADVLQMDIDAAPQSPAIDPPLSPQGENCAGGTRGEGAAMCPIIPLRSCMKIPIIISLQCPQAPPCSDLYPHNMIMRGKPTHFLVPYHQPGMHADGNPP